MTNECAQAARQDGNGEILELTDEVLQMLNLWDEYLNFRKQAVSQARITGEQDRLDLASAHVDLEKAKLEVSKQEIVSKLQGEESKIDLGLSEEKLRVQEATNNLHQMSDAQKMGSLTRLRDKASSLKR